MGNRCPAAHPVDFLTLMNKAAIEKHIRIAHQAEIVVICGECAKSFISEEECNIRINLHNASHDNSSDIPTFPCDQFPQSLKYISQH